MMPGNELQSEPLIEPVRREARISAVDAVRGLALLGILIMNAVDFALPHQAFDNPRVAGGATGVNAFTWAVVYILFEGKMRALFSMLFGAGVILITSRAEERGSQAGIADVFCRRNLWLLAFGMVHAYLIWWGDILFAYAVGALLFLYPLRKLTPKRLMIIAVMVLAFLIPRRIIEASSTISQRDKAMAADAAEKAGKKLTDEQKAAQATWADKKKEFDPTPEQVKKDIDRMRNGYIGPLQARLSIVPVIESDWFYRWGVFDTVGVMILGMALLKLGFFSAECSYKTYGIVALVGYGVFVPVNTLLSTWLIQKQWDPVVYAYVNTSYDFQRIAIALGHASVLMILWKLGAIRWLMSRLAAVGQMALSNYLTHSIVFSTIFYGYGFSLFGKLERRQIYYAVFGVWIFQLFVSKIWLAHFHYGPAEWAWRSLTYWKKQPMRIERPLAVPETEQTAAAEA